MLDLSSVEAGVREGEPAAAAGAARRCDFENQSRNLWSPKVPGFWMSTDDSSHLHLPVALPPLELATYK